METDNLKEIILDFIKLSSPIIEKLKRQSEKTAEICHKIDRSWSGFPFGENALYYYNDFNVPPAGSLWSTEWGTLNGIPDGWVYCQGEEVKNAIESFVGGKFNIKDYSDSYRDLLKSAQSLKDNISIEISDFEFTDKMEKEQELYKLIENFELGDINQLRADYINDSRSSGSFSSRDLENLSKGKTIPAHITTMAGVHAANAIIENIDKFVSLVNRFSNQIGKKVITMGKKDGLALQNFNSRLENIFNKFHKVVQQLKVRRDSRPTIEIKDEYDIQDLLYAILKIDFEDIRSEEWTPSYAGKSARMDFLLKKEKTVIEVKIISDKLKDKDLGEQLILDIAYYKGHADCGALYCFVYDPKSILTKGPSIVNDLQKKHDGLDVRVIIRPF